MAVRYRYRRPRLYAKQLQAIFSPRRYAVIEATPKCGKTFGCMVWLLEQAVNGRAGRVYWWVGPVATHARMVFERFKRQLPRQVYQAHETRQTLTLVNGALLAFKSGDSPDALFGEDVYTAGDRRSPAV